MFIIFASLIVIIIILFWQTIYSVITTYASNSSKLANTMVGNLWFICLLIINLSIMIFIYIFYYYKSTIKGKIGLDGKKGFEGEPGDPCYMKNNCIL